MFNTRFGDEKNAVEHLSLHPRIGGKQRIKDCVTLGSPQKMGGLIMLGDKILSTLW